MGVRRGFTYSWGVSPESRTTKQPLHNIFDYFGTTVRLVIYVWLMNLTKSGDPVPYADPVTEKVGEQLTTWTSGSGLYANMYLQNGRFMHNERLTSMLPLTHLRT